MQDIAPKCFDFLIFPGGRECVLYFERSERHFYWQKNKRKICTDSQFLSVVEDTKSKSIKFPKCNASPGKLHNHETPSQEIMEFVAFRWECLLRMMSNCETMLQSIEFVLSSTPYQLSLSSSVLECKLSPFLNGYKNRGTLTDEFKNTFLGEHGKVQLDRFRNAVLQFRSSSLRPSKVL